MWRLRTTRWLDLLWGLGGVYLLAGLGSIAGLWPWRVPGLGALPAAALLLLLLRRALAPGRPDPAFVNRVRRLPAGWWVAGYAVVLAALAVRKHTALESHGSDLGIFVNLFWNLTHGGGWHSGMLERHFLGEHFSPLLILVAPLYRCWSVPECLLVVQSAALALAAWPLYLLARARLGHGAGLVTLYAYFVYPPLRGIALHDFHEVALALPLLSGAVWWWHRGRTTAALLALAAAVLCKEELALTAAAGGLYLAVVRRDKANGIPLLLAGLAVFLLLAGTVVPAIRGAALPFADRYSQWPADLRDLLALAARHPIRFAAAAWTPAKGRYLLDLLRPLGLLPLLAPWEALPALPTLARNLLSNHEPQFSIHFHYPAPLVPFLFAAAIAGLDRARRGLAGWVRRWAARAPGGRPAEPVCAAVAHGAALGWLAAAAAWWGADLPRDWTRFTPPPRARALDELRALIPPRASVSAHNRLVPHIANRPQVWTFPVVGDADFVLLDFGYPDYEYPVHAETHRQRFLELLDSGNYRIRAARDKLVLLERRPAGPPDPALLDELFFRYRREHLRAYPGRRDTMWQGPRWFFPPGRWRATVKLTARAPTGPVVFSVHPYLGGRLDEWSLGSAVYDPAVATNAPGAAEVSLAWTFQQPRQQMLTLRVLDDRPERLRLQSLEFQPLDAAAARAALRLPVPAEPGASPP